EPKIISQDINVQFLKVFNLINKMSKRTSKCIIEKTIAVYLGIAKLLEISDDQIENAYFLKNQINFERIKNNY
ncbi:MAG: dUTP diphosphatase, partial [Mycoplasmataceae bacterium]|nr:dUTP diphosphatase [Mycoplasmataceae bacterium]